MFFLSFLTFSVVSIVSESYEEKYKKRFSLNSISFKVQTVGLGLDISAPMRVFVMEDTGCGANEGGKVREAGILRRNCIRG